MQAYVFSCVFERWKEFAGIFRFIFTLTYIVQAAPHDMLLQHRTF